MDTNEKKPEQQVEAEMAVDFAKGIFIVQMKGFVAVQLEDGSFTSAKVPAFQMPIPNFLQTAVNCMNQMLMKVAQESQAKSSIMIPRPGQVPGDLRKLSS